MAPIVEAPDSVSSKRDQYVGVTYDMLVSKMVVDADTIVQDRVSSLSSLRSSSITLSIEDNT